MSSHAPIIHVIIRKVHVTSRAKSTTKRPTGSKSAKPCLEMVSTRINQSTMTVKAMVDKIPQFLKAELSVPAHVTELAIVIEAAPLNLEEKSEKGYADFFGPVQGSAYMYRIAFAFPGPDMDQFYGFVVTLQLGANINELIGW